ncbi:MAG TPA: hypothetical protein VM223_19835 [Planctomycetota bacterium]|nr:hypothetical protein [Planctomycetota bacterium]
MKTTNIPTIVVATMVLWVLVPCGSAMAGELPPVPVNPVLPVAPMEPIILSIEPINPLARETTSLPMEPTMPNATQAQATSDSPAPDASFPPAPDATVPPVQNPPAQPAPAPQPAPAEPPQNPAPVPPPQNPAPQPVNEPAQPAPTAPAEPPPVVQPQPAQPPVPPLEAQQPVPANPPQPPAVVPGQAQPLIPEAPPTPAVPQNPPPAPVQPGVVPQPETAQNTTPEPPNAPPGQVAPPAPAPPATPPAVKSVTMLGFVQAAKVKSGVQSVNFVTPDAEYVVVMDQRGLDLGTKMADTRVEVTGIITDDKDRKLLTIQSFRPQLTGTVDSAISVDGRLMLARLITAGGTYVIVLDEKGVEIGSTMHGRKVNVIGTMVNERSRTKELLVKSWEEFREIQPFGPAPNKPMGQVRQ